MNKEQMVKVLARTEEDRIQAMGELSDHFKQVYNFRPRGFPSNMTWEEIEQTHIELSKMFETEQEAVKHYKKKMVKKADKLTTDFGVSKEDLVRWGCFNADELEVA